MATPTPPAFAPQQPPQVVTKRDASYYSILHVINVLFESMLLFFCSKNNASKLDEMYCRDTFSVGTGAVVSIVALVSGEAETSMLALNSLCAYHALVFFSHLNRYVNEGISPNYGSQVSVISVVNVVLLLQSLYFVLQVERTIQWDFAAGSFAALLTIIIKPTVGGASVLLVKPWAVLLMAARVWQHPQRRQTASSSSPQFSQLVALALAVSCVGDVAVEVSVPAGAAVYCCAQLIYIAAFTHESQELMLVTKAVPIFGYAFAMFFVALLPRMAMTEDSSSMATVLAVFLAVALIAALIWRASVLPNRSGLVFMSGSVALALAQTLLALHAFVSPIANVRYPVLALYFFGQALFTHAVGVKRAEQEEEEEDKDKPE